MPWSGNHGGQLRILPTTGGEGITKDIIQDNYSDLKHMIFQLNASKMMTIYPHQTFRKLWTTGRSDKFPERMCQKQRIRDENGIEFVNSTT